jgi:hypothetical protein
MMTALALLWLAAAGPNTTLVVQAPDSPVKIDRASVVNAPDAPPIVVFAATNTTDTAIDTVMLIAYTFSADGTLKARQTAPARRSLEPHETKFSTLVLDGFAPAPDSIVVIGVNQVQRANSETWWRAELQLLAQQAASGAATRGGTGKK